MEKSLWEYLACTVGAAIGFLYGDIDLTINPIEGDWGEAPVILHLRQSSAA